MPSYPQPPKFVLASSSPYRRELIRKLGLECECLPPGTDETPLPNESAPQLVQRLALQKAEAIAKTRRDHWIISSDQVATLNGQIMGKPHTEANAIKQLTACSGHEVLFLTSLCLYLSASKQIEIITEPFKVKFRSLSPSQISHYVKREQPLDCAGSFKCEGLGISLFEKLSGDDPNSLIGLPLIQLVNLLQRAGFDVLA